MKKKHTLCSWEDTNKFAVYICIIFLYFLLQAINKRLCYDIDNQAIEAMQRLAIVGSSVFLLTCNQEWKYLV